MKDQDQAYSAYMAFCGDMCRNFDKSWDSVGKRLDFAWQFLTYIPVTAWQPMVGIAVETWGKWPSNWTKDTKAIYELYRKKAPSAEQAPIRFCEYCNGNGHFTSIMPAEVQPGITVNYRFSWRCAACSNWFGQLGHDIPARYPLEVKSIGHMIELYPVPPQLEDKADNQHPLDLAQLISMAGVRYNPKTARPDYQPYND